MRSFKLTIIFFSVLLSCQAQEKTDLTIINDLPYYSGADQDDKKHKLNLVLPEKKNTPILIWLHGGAWAYGGRTLEMELAKKIAAQEIAVAAVSYRLSPAEYNNPPKTTGIQHPEHIKDVARAFSWIYNNATNYGYDADNIFIAGYSAGAHLAALLSMDERYLQAHTLDLSHIAGTIPISGTFDIPKYFDAIENAYGNDFAVKHVNGVFGPTGNFDEASPIAYIDQLDLPMLVISDGALAMYSDTFKEALVENGVTDVPFIYYPQFNHAQLADDLSKNPDSEARQEMIKFIKSNTRS